MFCNHCGKKISDVVTNCPYCGSIVDAQAAQTYTSENTQAYESAPQAETEYTQPVQQFEAPNQNYEAPKQDFNAPQPDYSFANTGSNIPADIDRKSVSKKDFLNKYASAAIKKNINSVSIVCYILCGLSVIANIFIGSDWYFLIDTVIILALILGMHLGKSKICAILLLVVSIIECIIGIVATGAFTGWLWIVASVSAISTFKKLDKEYNLFLMSGNNAAPITDNQNNIQQ